MDAAEVSIALTANAEAVARMLAPSGRMEGREYSSLNPTRNDSRLGSFKVNVTKGVFKDFATGDTGDLLSLWMLCKRMTFREALDDARSFLGITPPPALKSPPAKKREYRRPTPPAGIAPAVKLDAAAAYLKGERGLYPDTIKRWMISTAPHRTFEKKDKDTGEIRRTRWVGPWLCFPYLDRTKTVTNIKWEHLTERQDNGKKIRQQEQNAESTLFGWHLIDDNTRYAVLTEGEIDSMTVSQWGHPALSLPDGGGTGEKQRWIDNDWERLEQFSTIYLFLDDDETGQAAVTEIARRLGLHRVKVVSMPENTNCKDANDLLVKLGWTAEQFDALLAAAKAIEPEDLRSPLDYLDATTEVFYPSNAKKMGANLPWPGLEQKFRLRPSEVTVVSGTNGSGKTLILSLIELYYVEQGNNVCLFSGEMTAAQTWARAVKQLAVAEQPTRERIRHCMEWMQGRLYLYDVKGNADIDKMLEAFEYARRRFGCTLFRIDSLMKLGIDTDDYAKQKLVLEKLTAFAARGGVHVIIVAHPRKPKDDNDVPDKAGVAGTGDITNMADNVLILWRNRRKEERIEQLNREGAEEAEIRKAYAASDALLMCKKQRNFTWEGAIPLWFHKPSGSYKAHSADDYPRCASLDRQEELDAGL